MTAEDIRQCFNDSLHALFFPDLVQSSEGQEYLLALSNYVLTCGNGKTIAANCPDILCCFAQNYIAWLLSSWAAVDAISDDGTICLTDPAASQPATYLKSKEIGGVRCEFDIVDVSKTCRVCPDTAVSAWRSEWEKLLNSCNASYVICAGSYTPKICMPKGCGCGADYWKVY